MNLFLCIYLPNWDIQARQFKQRRTTDIFSTITPSPLLLVMTHGRQEVVARCCAACRRRGIFPGMAMAEARALLPRAMMAPFEPMESRRLLEKLAHWALKFSPLISVVEPFSDDEPQPGADSLLLNISGMEHLYGGPLAMARRIPSILRHHGLTCRVAIGPTIGSAIALARYAVTPATICDPTAIPAAITDFPTAALRISPDIQAMLREVGITRLAELMALPRDQLAVRFPAELLVRLDQLLGRRMELPPLITLSTAPAAQWRMDGPVENLEAILPAARTLTGQLAQELTRRHLGTTLLAAQLEGADIGTSTIMIPLAQAVRREDRLWAAIRPRMEQLRLTGGIEILTLRAMKTHFLPMEQLHADACTRWQSNSTMAPLAPVLDILRTRLPALRIRTATGGCSHLPEQSICMNILEEDGGGRMTPLDGFVITQRPSLLLNPPQPVQVITSATDEIPEHIQWHGRFYACRRVIGPERLTTAWWTGIPTATRDYFAVLDQTGQWLWIFHELKTEHWWLHGLWV